MKKGCFDTKIAVGAKALERGCKCRMKLQKTSSTLAHSVPATHKNRTFAI